MDASPESGNIQQVIALLVLIAIPIAAIALERGRKSVTRGRFALWSIGFCIALFIIFAYVGAAYTEFGLPPEVSVFPPLLAAYVLIFFYFQRITRRILDAGAPKAVAYCALVPGLNLLFVVLLLLLPSKDRAVNKESEDTELYSCFCKATDTESGEPRASWAWVMSRRAMFRIFDDRVQCGDWIFPFSEIRKATLYKAKQWPFTHKILQLELDERCVQFGFFPWANPIKHLKLDVEIRYANLNRQPFTIIFRIAVVGFIAYEIWKRAGTN